MSRTAVVGLGLIGGSIALACGARSFDADASTRERARRRGLDAAGDLASAVADADLVVLAVPTAAIPALLAEAARLAPGAVLTDCASLKRPIMDAAARLPERARFVGGHPMAGGRAPGIDGADAGLFRGRPWAIVPTSRSDAESVAAVEGLVGSVGARPVRLDAERHDRAMTWISHLPLAVSAALARAAESGGVADLSALAGPGFRDATRLASTPEALAAAIEAVAAELGLAAATLRRSDAPAAAAFFAGAREARRRLETSPPLRRLRTAALRSASRSRRRRGAGATDKEASCIRRRTISPGRSGRR
jgi:prephenate dehydrogenase